MAMSKEQAAQILVNKKNNKLILKTPEPIPNEIASFLTLFDQKRLSELSRNAHSLYKESFQEQGLLQAVILGNVSTFH